MNVGQIGSTKYRTSVLYDFSCVVKAVMFILKSEENSDAISKAAGIDYNWEFVESLPVQINPNSLKRVKSKKQNSTTIGIIDNEYNGGISGTTKNSSYNLINFKSSSESDELALELFFDVYDEYKAVSMDSLSPIGFIPGFAQNVSLADEETVIIEKLYSYSTTRNHFAFFRWGDLQFLGAIREFECDYTCFSPFGEPLKARVSLKLYKQFFGHDKHGQEKSPGFFELGKAWAEINAYSNLNKVQIVASRTSEEAAVVAAPNILRKIRND